MAFDALTRASAVEAVEGGRLPKEVAREMGMSACVLRVWVREHRCGKRTVAMLRAGVKCQIEIVRHYSPVAPSDRLAVLVSDWSNFRGRHPTATQVLYRTASYVLHPDAPVDHLAAWIRFFVQQGGMD